jgi:hypothetical protein
MVRNILSGSPLELSSAFSRVFRRLPTILAAGVISDAIVFIGLGLFAVPGIYFLTLYIYAIPAIMADECGVLAGISASKSFGKYVKLKTFLVLLVVYGTVALSGLLSFILDSYIWRIASSGIALFSATWASVAISYIYLKYGITPKVEPAV